MQVTLPWTLLSSKQHPSMTSYLPPIHTLTSPSKSVLSSQRPLLGCVTYCTVLTSTALIILFSLCVCSVSALRLSACLSVSQSVSCSTSLSAIKYIPHVPLPLDRSPTPLTFPLTLTLFPHPISFPRLYPHPLCSPYHLTLSRTPSGLPTPLPPSLSPSAHPLTPGA